MQPAGGERKKEYLGGRIGRERRWLDAELRQREPTTTPFSGEEAGGRREAITSVRIFSLLLPTYIQVLTPHPHRHLIIPAHTRSLARFCGKCFAAAPPRRSLFPDPSVVILRGEDESRGARGPVSKGDGGGFPPRAHVRKSQFFPKTNNRKEKGGLWD